jgi:hypothetical protein
MYSVKKLAFSLFVVSIAALMMVSTVFAGSSQDSQTNRPWFSHAFPGPDPRPEPPPPMPPYPEETYNRLSLQDISEPDSHPAPPMPPYPVDPKPDPKPVPEPGLPKPDPEPYPPMPYPIFPKPDPKPDPESNPYLGTAPQMPQVDFITESCCNPLHSSRRPVPPSQDISDPPPIIPPQPPPPLE